MKRPLLLILIFLFICPTVASAKLDKETSEQIYTVLERATRSGDRSVRALAVQAIGPLRGKETRTYAIDALKDPVWGVRAAAVRTLIALKDSAYSQVLYDAMANPRRNMKAEIMPLLAMLPDKAAVAISHKLLGDEKANTRNELIEAWADQPSKRRMMFYKSLIGHKDTQLAEAVQGFVLKLKGKDVLSLVAQVLKAGNSAMKSRALEVLATYPKGTKMPFVRKLIKSADPTLKMRAAEVLAHHGDSASKKILMPVLESKVDKDIIRALDALAKVASKDMVPSLLGFLNKRTTHHGIIEKSLEILYRVKDPSLVQRLRKLRTSDNIKVQAHAIYYLGLIEKGRGLVLLHEDMFHGDPNVRLAAIKAVGRIGSRESIASLKRALDNTRSPNIREAIVKALATIKDRGIIQIVSFLITDPTPGVRKWAIIALTNVKHRDAVSSLKIALQDVNIETRSEALKAILLLDKGEGLSVFRRALGWLPVDAFKGLADVLKGGMLPYLDIALTHSRPEIRKTAMELLGAFKAEQTKVLVSALTRSRTDALKIDVLERLAFVNGASELNRLLTFAESRQVNLRSTALRLMGVIRNMGADPVLRKALYDPSEQPRIQSAISLLNLHSKKKRRR